MDDMNDSLQDFFHFFRREGPAALLAGFEALGAAPPPPHILVEDITQMLETSISCIISNWNNARSGSNGLQTVPQHIHSPGTLPPNTNNIADGISTHSRLPQFLNPATSTAHATTPNASIGGSSSGSSSAPFETPSVPHILITSDENNTVDETNVDEPFYSLDDEETADFTKLPSFLPPLEWDSNWDQEFAEQQ